MTTPNWMSAPTCSVEQPDGAQWNVYENPDSLHQFTIITSVGGELIQDPVRRHDLLGLLRRYRAAELGGVALFGEDPDVRQWLGSGQEATVYKMGPYAIREENGLKSMYGALGEFQRMNEIGHVIDSGLPRWLHLPLQYAVHTDPTLQKTYTLMERIDSGVTVEDILAFPDLEDKKRNAVKNAIGHHITEAQGIVPVLFDRAHEVLSSALSASGKVPEEFLTDWRARNVLVERLGTPVAGSKYSLHVIDQYRP
jgi:hypothetical protein